MRLRAKLISLALVIVSGSLLMITSQLVQNLEREKERLKFLIDQENKKIRFLETEWAYLKRPKRIEKLAESLAGGMDDFSPKVNNTLSDVVSTGQDIPEPMRPVTPVQKPFVPAGSTAKPVTIKMENPESRGFKANSAFVNKVEPAAGKDQKSSALRPPISLEQSQSKSESKSKSFDALIDELGTGKNASPDNGGKE